MTADRPLLTNGIPGFIADQTITPFVTGWVPVVGTFPPAADAPKGPRPPKPVPAGPPPGTSARPSSAAQPAPSVAEARRLRAADAARSNAEAEGWLARGQKAEAAGKLGVARVCYQTAARQATGEVKQRAIQRLEALATRPQPD